MTAATQDTDKKHSQFKTVLFLIYLIVMLIDCCLRKNINFALWDVGLFVFGGIDPETGLDWYLSTFADAFTKISCIVT